MAIMSSIAKIAYKFTPARKAALQKAIAASAKARAKTGVIKSVGRVAATPFKAYGSSVIKRAAKKKTKTLSKISSSLNMNKKTFYSLVSPIKASSLKVDVAKGRLADLNTALSAVELRKASMMKSGSETLRWNNMITRRRLRNLMKEQNDLIGQRSMAAKEFAQVNAMLKSEVGRQAAAQQQIDALQNIYTVMSQKNFIGRTAASDFAIIGGAAAGAAALIKYNQDKKSK
jgi:hypothetical protein